MQNNLIKKLRGFTLIELVIVMVIVSIMAVISHKAILQGYSAYRNAQELMDANWQGRYALERMAREIRRVARTSAITVATSTTLTFNDTNDENITFSRSGTQLMRNNADQLNTNVVLADGIGNLAFTYYDASGATTATPANIRFVQVTLTVTLNNTNFSESTAVFVRNQL